MTSAPVITTLVPRIKTRVHLSKRKALALPARVPSASQAFKRLRAQREGLHVYVTLLRWRTQCFREASLPERRKWEYISGVCRKARPGMCAIQDWHPTPKVFKESCPVDYIRPLVPIDKRKLSLMNGYGMRYLGSAETNHFSAKRCHPDAEILHKKRRPWC